MACRLIINADDFGWSESVNEAVARLAAEGAITSTSLMVGAPAAAEAVERLASLPDLAVGLHLTFLAAPAVLPREEIPRLVDRRGWFPRDPIRAGIRYSCRPVVRNDLQREARAQFKAFTGTGQPLSHVDTHVHMGLTPSIFDLALRLAREHRAVGFRVPEDDYALYRRLDPEDARRQWGMAVAFRHLCAGQRERVAAAGLHSPRRCYGFFRSGRLDVPYLVRLIEELPDGDLELHCHPDLGTESGRREYAALQSGEVRRALDRRGVVLSTYRSWTAQAGD